MNLSDVGDVEVHCGFGRQEGAVWALVALVMHGDWNQVDEKEAADRADEVHDGFRADSEKGKHEGKQYEAYVQDLVPVLLDLVAEGA